MTVQGSTILKPIRKIEEAGFPGVSIQLQLLLLMSVSFFFFKTLLVGSCPG